MLRRVLTVMLFTLLVSLLAETLGPTALGQQRSARIEDHPFWSILGREARLEKLREIEEREMATLAIVIAVSALVPTLFVFYRFQSVSRRVKRMEAGTLSPQEKHQLTEALAEIGSLREQIDQLHRTLPQQFEELRRSASQLDGKVTKIEATCSGLAAISDELKALKSFKDGVEQIHGRLREALNGSSKGKGNGNGDGNGDGNGKVTRLTPARDRLRQ